MASDVQRRIARLAARAHAHDGVRPFGEHKWLRLLRGDDRVVALLVWDGSQLIGAAHCSVYHTAAPSRPCRLTAELVIDPARRQAGLGQRLLGSVLDLAAEEGVDDVHLWAYGNLTAAQHLATRWQVHPVRVLLQYGLAREQLPATADFPGDVRLRSFEPARDAGAWLDLHARVFAGHPEQSTWDAHDLQLRLEQPWFDAHDVLIAEDVHSQRMIGFCWTKLPLDAEQPGEIYIVGVDPAARGRGLGRLLTEAGLAHMGARGRPGATLYVEADNAAARTLYERLGFRLQHTHVCYGR